jgi:beta-lactam-binding protein with PASTA domain/predicted Ser/Thr protein kinase
MSLRITPGTMIDRRYRVISRVGSGGMAEVYCAEDSQLGRRVAVKLLHERFAQDEEFVERFRREASSAASLSHANIVSVYDRGEWGGTYYIAMEYLDGRSLDSIVREEAPLEPSRALEIIEQVLRAARFAHRHGVVHRDLKPHNVIIDEEGRVKVTDFGIARAGVSEITETGSIMGTARYLSPEQAQGQAVGQQSDVYSIGIMLYELLTGTVPFEGDSVVAIALRHLSEPPRPPSSLVPSIAPSLDAIVMRALEKAPEHRFEDADAFLRALEAERERLRSEDGSRTAALAPIVPVAPFPLTPATAWGNPATNTTQALGPVAPLAGGYGTDRPYWDPNTTGVIPPGAILLPPAPRRAPIWPWALLGAVITAAAVVALIFVLIKPTPVVNQVKVPGVVGTQKADAVAILGNAGFLPLESLVHSPRPGGTVVAEFPHGGTFAKRGAQISLHISSGPATPASRQVPSLLGDTASSALRTLRALGFKISPSHVSSTTVPKNAVISTNPGGGATAPHGSIVAVVISSGPPSIAVPNVVGETADLARLLLQQELFAVVEKPKTTTSAVAGTVLDQSPKRGKQPQGATITLTVATAPTNVTVPYLVGQTEAAAAAQLGKLGLTPNAVTVIKNHHPEYDGLVLHQVPAAGTSLAPGSIVQINVEQYVALGPTGPTSTGPSGPTGVSGLSGPTGTT